MKTILTYTFALALITLGLSANASTNTPPYFAPLSQEAYINDIPFNTETIFDSLLDVNMTQTFNLSDEDYIQDIPFDTQEVVENASDESIGTFNLEDESYINDIPFSTQAIAKL